MTDFRLTRPGLSRRICQYYLEWGRMGASVVSVGAAQPVPRPGTRRRSGGTAGYCDDLLTVSVASCPLSTHVSLSLRAICPDRAQTRDLPAHPLWGGQRCARCSAVGPPKWCDHLHSQSVGCGGLKKYRVGGVAGNICKTAAM